MDGKTEIADCKKGVDGSYVFEQIYTFDYCTRPGLNGTVIPTGETRTDIAGGVHQRCFCGSLLVGQSGDYILHKPDACSQDADGNTIDIHTAIGCIPVKPEAFVKVILNWAIGIAGGIAFMFMLFSAFQILASRGNPEALKAAQEQLTAAVIGLLFIIFSVFLLRIIGVPIMNIGG